MGARLGGTSACVVGVSAAAIRRIARRSAFTIGRVLRLGRDSSAQRGVRNGPIKAVFAGAAILCAMASTQQAFSAPINWRQFQGTTITWAYDIHPYADAVVAQLPEFEKLTGIKVQPELYPDDTYWNKLTVQLTTKSPTWDVVGTGIQPAWDLTPAGLLEPLNEYLADTQVVAVPST